MKFMSNAGVFIVIAAFAACAAGTDALSQLRQRRTLTTGGCDSRGNCGGTVINRMKREDVAPVGDNGESADDEQPGDSLRLRLRRCVSRHQCDSNGNCVFISACRMKREDFDIMDAAMGVYEDEISKHVGNHRARRSSNSDLVEEDALAAGALRHRLRRCVFTVGRDSKGSQAETIACRMKREDYAILDAAMGVYEDAAPVGDNGESADDEQPDALSQFRQRRTVRTGGCDRHGGCGGTVINRMKREDVVPVGDNGESADDEQPDALSQLRQRRTVTTGGCDRHGGCGVTVINRMKRTPTDGNNCRWQCVCTTVQGASSSGSRGRRDISTWGGNNRGESLSTTVTSGPCFTQSQGQATCRSIETCY